MKTPPSKHHTDGLKYFLLAILVLMSLTLASCSSATPTPSTVVINSVKPAFSLPEGGTSVTISGFNFGKNPMVFFDELPASAVTVLDNRKLQAIPPKHAIGRVKVRVENEDGLSGLWSGRFRYSATSFREISTRSGIDFKHFRDERLAHLGGGAAVADFNNDGFIDIYAVNSKGSNALFRNNGDGTFTDVAHNLGVAGPFPSGNGAGWADYDNDGDADLFVSSYGGSRLYQNEGKPAYQFTDVTAKAGVRDPDPSYRTTGIAWGDYDSDGFLDLMVVRHLAEANNPEAFYIGRDFSEQVRLVALFHNEGNGRFSNVTSFLDDLLSYPSSVRTVGFKPAFLDYDNDGDQDIYLVNDFGGEIHPNVLWRNDGPSPGNEWEFTDVSGDTGSDVSGFLMGLAIGDYDNDLDLDLYITDMGPSLLLRNNGGTSFTEIAAAAGVARGEIHGMEPSRSIGWGAVFFDYDNDGWLDLYMVAGFLDNDPAANQSVQPNALFANNLDGTFDDISAISGASDPEAGRGVAVADFDNDGKLDIFLMNIGDGLGNPGNSKLFKNVSPNQHNWLSIRTIGSVSNRNGVGARIIVTSGSLVQIREVGASQAHMSHHLIPVHFGLGNKDLIDSIEIRWPSGTTQILKDIKSNQMLVVTEP